MSEENISLRFIRRGTFQHQVWENLRGNRTIWLASTSSSSSSFSYDFSQTHKGVEHMELIRVKFVEGGFLHSIRLNFFPSNKLFIWRPKSIFVGHNFYRLLGKRVEKWQTLVGTKNCWGQKAEAQKCVNMKKLERDAKLPLYKTDFSPHHYW